MNKVKCLELFKKYALVYFFSIVCFLLGRGLYDLYLLYHGLLRVNPLEFYIRIVEMIWCFSLVLYLLSRRNYSEKGKILLLGRLILIQVCLVLKGLKMTVGLPGIVKQPLSYVEFPDMLDLGQTNLNAILMGVRYCADLDLTYMVLLIFLPLVSFPLLFVEEMVFGEIVMGGVLRALPLPLILVKYGTISPWMHMVYQDIGWNTPVEGITKNLFVESVVQAYRNMGFRISYNELHNTFDVGRSKGGDEVVWVRSLFDSFESKKYSPEALKYAYGLVPVPGKKDLYAMNYESARQNYARVGNMAEQQRSKNLYFSSLPSKYWPRGVIQSNIESFNQAEWGSKMKLDLDLDVLPWTCEEEFSRALVALKMYMTAKLGLGNAEVSLYVEGIHPSKVIPGVKELEDLVGCVDQQIVVPQKIVRPGRLFDACNDAWLDQIKMQDPQLVESLRKWSDRIDFVVFGEGKIYLVECKNLVSAEDAGVWFGNRHEGINDKFAKFDSFSSKVEKILLIKVNDATWKIEDLKQIFSTSEDRDKVDNFLNVTQKQGVKIKYDRISTNIIDILKEAKGKMK